MIGLAKVGIFQNVQNRLFDCLGWLLRGIITIWDLITLPVYWLIDRPWKIRRHSEQQWAEKHLETNANYTYWQCPELIGQLIGQPANEEHIEIKSQLDSVRHLSELLSIVQKRFANLKCIGKRRVIGKRVENGQTKYELSDYQWLTYRTLVEQVHRLSRVLHHKFQLKHADRVAIMADTGPEWFISYFALQCLGCQVVTIPTTSDPHTIRFILNLSKVNLVFTHREKVKVLNKIRLEIPDVRELIIIESPFAVGSDDEPKHELFNLFDYDELLNDELASHQLNHNHSKFDDEDVSTIIFTSGSTGQPKGVLLTHRNMIQNTKCYSERVPFAFGMNNEDTFIAYLPASHIFELICEIMLFMAGCKIAYGSPQTLPTGAPLLAGGCAGDIQASAATTWVGMPLVFERLRSQLQTMMSRSSLAVAVYRFAYEYKRYWSKRGYECRLTDALLFGHIRRAFGGRLKYLLTGGAPLLHESSTFLKQVLGVSLTVVYGSTEVGAICLSSFDKFDDADTVVLQSGVKLRLDDWEEAGYRSSDRPNARGEIILGGLNASPGYLENEKATEKYFFEEDGVRWWRSGDIGEINQLGHLAIVDRKKNFAKLQNGRYVAMGRTEAVLKNCAYVQNLAVHVDSYQDQITAIVQPNRENVFELAKSIGRPIDKLKALCEDERLKQAIVDELIKFGKSNGLHTKEIPHLITLCHEIWSPQNGLLTASMKLNRTQIYGHYRRQIEQMYKTLKSGRDPIF